MRRGEVEVGRGEKECLQVLKVRQERDGVEGVGRSEKECLQASKVRQE